MPAAEMLDEHSREHVDICFKMAEKYGALMDMHIDQSKDMFDRSLEYTAWLTMQRGWQGRVTGGGYCTGRSSSQPDRNPRDRQCRKGGNHHRWYPER